MESYLSLIINRLHEENYSCIVGNGNEIRTFKGQSVNDLFDLYRYEPSFLNGATVADKIVGKAAAALMLLGKIRSVYAEVISESALDLFSNSDVEVEYDNIVPFIENRDKTGWCPLEEACYGLKTPEEIYPVIRNRILKTDNHYKN
jgi:iron complex outermembrane receptor protein/vitamin B12 transporter